MESLLGLSVQSQCLIFLLMQIPSCTVMKWFGDSHEILDELVIMTNNPKESMDCSVCCRFEILSYCPEVVVAWPYPFSQDTMTQVFNLLSENKLHLESLSFNPFNQNHSNTSLADPDALPVCSNR